MTALVVRVEDRRGLGLEGGEDRCGVAEALRELFERDIHLPVLRPGHRHGHPVVVLELEGDGDAQRQKELFRQGPDGGRLDFPFHLLLLLLQFPFVDEFEEGWNCCVDLREVGVEELQEIREALTGEADGLPAVRRPGAGDDLGRVPFVDPVFSVLQAEPEGVGPDPDAVAGNAAPLEFRQRLFGGEWLGLFLVQDFQVFRPDPVLELQPDHRGRDLDPGVGRLEPASVLMREVFMADAFDFRVEDTLEDPF